MVMGEKEGAHIDSLDGVHPTLLVHKNVDPPDLKMVEGICLLWLEGCDLGLR
jgi:hypothetical protein